MSKPDWVMKATLLSIALFLGLVALRPYVRPDVKVSADSARFDHVHFISPMFLYKGQNGVLLMDKRNANVWFVPKGDDINVVYKDPVFVVRLPLEKLDQAPQ